jgi:hypothetical protein
VTLLAICWRGCGRIFNSRHKRGFANSDLGLLRRGGGRKIAASIANWHPAMERLARFFPARSDPLYLIGAYSMNANLTFVSA